jgi:hypothetical protein
MLPVEFEPTIPARARPKAHALDLAATPVVATHTENFDKKCD